MFWRRVQPATAAPRAARQTVGLEDLTRRARKRITGERRAARLAELAAGHVSPLPDRDTVVANVRARRAALKEQ